MRQGKANDHDEQNEPITGMHGIEVFSLVEGRKSKSSEMSNEVRRERRTSGDNMARGPAQQIHQNTMVQNTKKTRPDTRHKMRLVRV